MRRYLRATFESLRNRNYRIFYAGQTVSIVGTWMQKVAQVWLVLELTDSGVLLGVTAALQQLPTLLLTPWGGLLADRLDKRKILLVTQASAAVPALALGVLTLTGDITIWVVMALALLLGVIEAFDKPARHTFVSELVGTHHLANAVTLNNVMFNVGKVAGPAVAGILIVDGRSRAQLPHQRRVVRRRPPRAVADPHRRAASAPRRRDGREASSARACATSAADRTCSPRWR